MGRRSKLLFTQGSYLMKRQRGFSLLELFVVAGVAAVLIGILLSRLTYYQEMAEKAEMEFTISALKSAMRERIASLMIHGRAQDYVLLVQQNPMEWLEQKPSNYLGEFAHPDAKKMQPGSWYFDSVDKVLIYVVKSGAYFEPDSRGNKQVRLHVVLISNGPSAVADSKQIAQVTDTVTLRLKDPYKWF